MKINIAYPVTAQQKVFEIEDERKLRSLYDKRISNEVEGETLGDEFKGYVFRISGGNDKQGFCMKQGVLTAGRVRLLFRDGMSGYRERRDGERRRKSARGCIVNADMSVVNLVIVKKGEADIDGLTTDPQPRRRGPKRATKIRKLFNLTKQDDVRKFVTRTEYEKKGKKHSRAPKIQRLITPQRLQRKRKVIAAARDRRTKSKAEAKVYNDMISARLSDARHKRAELHEAKRAERKSTSDVKSSNKK